MYVIFRKLELHLKITCPVYTYTLQGYAHTRAGIISTLMWIYLLTGNYVLGTTMTG